MEDGRAMLWYHDAIEVSTSVIDNCDVTVLEVDWLVHRSLNRDRFQARCLQHELRRLEDGL